MATLLYRIGRTAFRRWPLFVAGWLVVLLGIGAFAATMSQPMKDSFTIPGIPSEEAADLQQELFPGAEDAFDQATVTVVVAAEDGKLAQHSDQVNALIADLAELPQMPDDPQLANPVQAAPAMRQQVLQAARESGTPTEVAQANADAVSPLSEDGRVGTMEFTFDVDSVMEVEPETLEATEEVLDEHSRDGLRVEANGQGMAGMVELDGTAELIGIGVALLVLVLTFGSMVAAGLPILNALAGISVTMGGIYGVTAFTDVGTTTPILAMMIGLAVGIDYSLFILARYRAELQHTDDREDAMGIAVGTAGSAVVFAGLTVLIALAALAVVRIPFLTTMGLAAAGAVTVAVLVALTLLPALIGITRRKTFALQVRRYRPARDERGMVVNNGVRWARLIGRGPVVALLLVVVGLGALAIPMKDLHLAFPTDSTAAEDTTRRQASDLIADSFGPGREAPVLVVVDGRGLSDPRQQQAAYGEVAAWAGQQDGVVNAQVVGMNDEGTGAQVLVTPATGPDDSATEDLLQDLRDGQAEVEQATGATLGITGLTAITVDVSERLAEALPVYLAVAIGLAFLLLMLVFRSILVPLTATLGFLLSVLATLGVTVAVFQEGALGLMEGQPIVSFMPIILIGLVFGLAMDYQVVRVPRIREAHVHGASPREAVHDGFRNSARVVAAAAVIMISVFAAFVLMDDPIIKSMGFALAVAVAFDAFLVRMTLIPALMYVMGERAWWLPRWLDRLIPNVDVEGEALERNGHSHTGAEPQRESLSV